VTELIGGREPDDRVDVVGHDDEADASAILQGQLGAEDPEHDALSPIVVEEPTAAVAREGHEVRVALPVVGALEYLAEGLGMARVPDEPRVAARPGQQVVRAIPSLMADIL